MIKAPPCALRGARRGLHIRLRKIPNILSIPRDTAKINRKMFGETLVETGGFGYNEDEPRGKDDDAPPLKTPEDRKLY